jgi:hypothetical protein
MYIILLFLAPSFAPNHLLKNSNSRNERLPSLPHSAQFPLFHITTGPNPHDLQNLRLPRNNRPVVNRIPMIPRHQTIRHQIPIQQISLIPFSLPSSSIRKNSRIQKRQHLNNTRRIPPIPHQIHHDPKHTHQMHARLLHTTVCVCGQLVVEGA